MVLCRYCGRDIKLTGPGLDRLWRHRKYARRSNGQLIGPAGNVCPGSGQTEQVMVRALGVDLPGGGS